MSTGPLKYGLPLRPPTASRTLWAHILRQDTQPSASLSDTPIVVPPTVPLDKNATSMRVLLHDTQANFEKFANHVGKLIDGVNESKYEIKTMNDLFERDRKTLVGDIIDLINRSQKEIQKSVGSPCQTSSAETCFKDINHRLDTLDQRLDAIQAFNQTHSQTLQTQIQAIQILLDKQGTIVSAVLPLLPLLQAVPLQIEAARSTLNDAICKLPLTQKLTSDSPDQGVAVKTTGKRKRPQRSPSSSPLTESLSKRRNLTDNILNARPISIVQSSGEKADVTSSVHQHRPFELSSSATHSLFQKSSPLTHPADKNSPPSRRSTLALPNFTPPRKPLSDLLVQPSRQATLKPSNTRVYGNSIPRSNTTMSRPSPRDLLDITPTAARPPRMLRVHASISNDMGTNMDPSYTSTKFGPTKKRFDILTSSTSSNPDMFTTFKVPALSPVPPSPFLSSRMNHSAVAKTTPDSDMPTLDREIHVDMPPPGQKVLPMEKPPIDRVKGTLVVPTALALGNMRETPKIGRRFIPLVDSEDEDEE